MKIDHIIFSSEFFFTLLLCVGHINLPEILSFFVVVFLVQSVNCPFFFLFFAFFFKVVHHIHGWRAAKLLTCFIKDTGCRNQSMLGMTCECLSDVLAYIS